MDKRTAVKQEENIKLEYENKKCREGDKTKLVQKREAGLKNVEIWMKGGKAGETRKGKDDK